MRIKLIKEKYRDDRINSYFFTGTSSPSKLILNLMPTLNPILLASRYLFRLTMYWLWLNLSKQINDYQRESSCMKISMVGSVQPWSIIHQENGISLDSM